MCFHWQLVFWVLLLQGYFAPTFINKFGKDYLKSVVPVWIAVSVVSPVLVFLGARSFLLMILRRDGPAKLAANRLSRLRNKFIALFGVALLGLGTMVVLAPQSTPVTPTIAALLAEGLAWPSNVTALRNNPCSKRLSGDSGPFAEYVNVREACAAESDFFEMWIKGGCALQLWLNGAVFIATGEQRPSQSP